MIATADSVTQPGEVAGLVLVAGSHGGRVAAHYAAKAGVRAVILNDAGIGLERAGVAGLDHLESIGMAAAAVDHASARIGDGSDMLARGVVSHANSPARALGVRPGMTCAEAAIRMARADMPAGALAPFSEGRYDLMPGVRGVDSIGMLQPDDEGFVLVAGSHCALHGGRPESALQVRAACAIFHDAGGATSRLPELDRRAIAAAAVDCRSARIGDARSMWATGILSFVNRHASGLGLAPGMAVAAAAARVCAARQER